MITSALQTGPSAWQPLAMASGAIAIMIVVFALRLFGRKGFKYGKEKAMPFYSGNVVTEGARVKASDFFWGFFEAFKGYYSEMKSLHSGIVNDYILWFVVVASLVLVSLALGVIIWA